MRESLVCKELMRRMPLSCLKIEDHHISINRNVYGILFYNVRLFFDSTMKFCSMISDFLCCAQSSFFVAPPDCVASRLCCLWTVLPSLPCIQSLRL